MRGPDFQIAPEQTPGLFRDRAIHMSGKERHAHQSADPYCDTDEEIEEVAPGPSGFPPRHGKDEAIHGAGSLAFRGGMIISSDSIRPSRRVMTRWTNEAIALSCVTSTSVV